MAQAHGDVEVTVDEEGNISLEAKGIQGKGCIDLTKELEKELGQTSNRRLKGSFHAKPRQHLQQGHDS